MNISIYRNVLPTITLSGIADIEPPYIHFRRTSADYIFYYILEGELWLSEEEEKYHLQENDYIFLEPGKEHVGYKSSACRFLYVHFKGDFVCRDSLCKDIISVSKTGQISHVSDIVTLNEAAAEFGNFTSLNKIYIDMVKSCDFLKIMCIIARSSERVAINKNSEFGGKIGFLVPELINYLQNCYAEEITGETIEIRFNYNFDYLNRQFKKWTGQTIFHYLNGVRIEHAKSLILTQFYSMEEVAYRCGFHDTGYFYRVFKKYTKTTPGSILEL